MNNEEIRGNIEHCDEHYLEGWIANTREPSRSISLNIFINETPFYCLANIFREDLERKFGLGNGNHGFKFELDDRIFSGTNVLRIVLPEFGDIEFQQRCIYSKNTNELSLFLEDKEHFDFDSDLKDSLNSIPVRSIKGTEFLRSVLAETKLIFIFFTNRTGSNLITDMLMQMGVGKGVSLEPFLAETVIEQVDKHSLEGIDHYLANVIRDWRRNGFCFLKISWDALFWLTKEGLLQECLSNSLVIFSRRRDKTMQAISYIKALDTGVFFRRSNSISNDVQLPIPLTQTERLDHTSSKAALIGKTTYQLCVADARLEYFLQLFPSKRVEIIYEDMICSVENTSDSLRREIELQFNTRLGISTYEPTLIKQGGQAEKELQSDFYRALREELRTRKR